MTDYICPECFAGKHQNCDGTAWDTEKDAPTRCLCSHSTVAPGGLIKEDYAWRDSFLTAIQESDREEIEALLMGHSVDKVADDHLVLDDGTLFRVVPNNGGCSCGAGDYDLTVLNRVENVITKVEFDYRPTGDDHRVDERWADSGYYRIFVFAGDEKVNLLQVDGDDGNGYYGTGFSLLVRKVVVQ